MYLSAAEAEDVAGCSVAAELEAHSLFGTACLGLVPVAAEVQTAAMEAQAKADAFVATPQ